MTNQFTVLEQQAKAANDVSVHLGIEDQLKDVIRNADMKLVNMIHEDLIDLYGITEFLIKFSEQDEYYHLDIEFIKELKTK